MALSHSIYEWQPNRTAHQSYSCEQQDNYLLRGRPTAVCVYTSGPRSCVIAPSIEAKQQGVRTGMKLAEAALLYPGPSSH